MLPLNAEDEASLRSQLFRLATPAMLHGIVITVVFFTDRLILGQYSESAISSMGISGPLLWSVFSVFGGFLPGIVATAGRAVGRQSWDEAAAIARGALAFAVFTGLLITLVGQLTAAPVAYLLVDSDPASREVARQAIPYLRICYAIAPIYMFSMACATVLQASGDTRTPMFAGLVSGLVNLGISWGLVFGHGPFPELGVTGAAIGTACAFSAEALIMGTVLLRGTSRVPMHLPVPWSTAMAGLRNALWVARPSYMEKLIFHAGFMTFTYQVGQLGPHPMAAHQAVLAVEAISFVAAEAFGVAAGALVAQKLGAGRKDLAWRASVLSVRYASLMLLVVSVVFVAVPSWLVSPFLESGPAMQLAVQCLFAAALAQPLMAFSDALSGVLRGAGDTRTPMYTAIIGPVIVRLSACWLLAYVFEFGLVGIWMGSTIDWAVRSLWLGWAWRRRAWLDTEVRSLSNPVAPLVADVG